MREDIGAAATVRAEKIAHVFNDAEDRRLDPLEHSDGAACVDQSKVLRRGDNDRSAQGNLLRQRQLHVAGAGGMSTTRASSSPQATSPSICISA